MERKRFNGENRKVKINKKYNPGRNKEEKKEKKERKNVMIVIKCMGVYMCERRMNNVNNNELSESRREVKEGKRLGNYLK